MTRRMLSTRLGAEWVHATASLAAMMLASVPVLADAVAP